MKRKTKNIIALFLLLLCFGAVQAQVDDKGVTSTGKEIDCFTITPEDRVVNEYGAIVTQPRLTRNGKIITDDCCPTLVESSLTDTVTCVSISMAATIQKGTFKTGILQVFSDANYSTSVGEFAASVTDNKITAKATGLTCYTRYYFKLTLNGQCEYVWTDSTRDATLEKATFCTVASVRAQSGSDLSSEHPYNGSTTQIDSVYDHEGNAYGVVQIGDQCWLKENMRARTSPRQGEGAGQVNLKTATSGTNNNAPYYYNSNSSTQLVTDLRDRGYLYNWVAAMDTSYTADNKQPASIDFECRRGICPMGWHLPTDAEWNELEKTSLTQDDGTTPITDATLALNSCFRGKGAGKFTGGCDWNYNGLATSPGNKTNADYNATGFSALPVGYYRDGDFLYSGQQTRFWTASSNATTSAKGRYFQYDNEGVYRDNTAQKKRARSVRCVRNVETTVADIQISKVTCSSVNVATKMLTGNVNNAVNVLVSTQSNFSDTVDVKTLTIPADSILSTDFYDLKTNTTYYVKIADKTANFTTQLCACSVPQTRADNEHVVDGKVYEVQDVDGNWYGVVEIGGQCWTRQNMRCTTSPKTGDRIVTNNGYSTISRSAKWYANDSTTYAKYGLLYNACAALDVTRNATDPAVAASNSTATAGWTFTAADPVQGICPDGWHLPADSEWTRMENYIVTDGHYNLSLTPSPAFASKNYAAFPNDSYNEGTNTPVSPMLAYLDTWTASNTIRATASADTNRNKVQFEAKAAGYFLNNNTKAGIGNYAAFWTATPYGNNMFIRQMRNSTAGIGRLNAPKYCDISVRCVRGVLIPKVALCGDCDDESIVLKSVTNVDSCALLNSFKEFVTSKKKPEVDSKFAGLAPGKYYLVSTSITGYVTMDSVTLVGRVHIPCVGKPHTGTEISAGVYANNEWGSTVRNEIDSVSDHEGNVYEVVQIGDQCWLRENMRATSSPKNPGVSMVNPLNKTGDQSVQSYVSRIAHYYNNDSTTYAKRYGLLYNWVAAVDTNKSGSPAIATGASTTTWSCPFTVARRGICPLGWHVPSSDEWTTMEDYVLSQYQPEITPNTGNPKATNTALVSILSSGCDWNYVSGVSDSPSDYDNVLRNVSGFSAVPAGCYETTIHDGGLSAQFWKATQIDAKNAGVAVFITSGAGIQDYASDKHIGRSVRCVRDVIYPEFTTCTDTINGTITLTTAKYTKKVEVFNSSDELVRTKHNAVAYSEFSKLPTGRYVVKATSRTDHVTVDTVDVKFTPTYCSVASLNSSNESGNGTRLDSVKDHQGNSYLVVQIGDQCWLRENMRATTLPSGRTMGVCTENGHTELNSPSVGPTYFLNQTSNGHVDFYEKYGCMYNWIAIMDTTSNVNNTQISITYPHRGICPQGWHVPEISEFATMFNYVVSDNHYGVNVVPSPVFDYATHIDKYVGTNTPIAAMLAGGCDWTPSTDDKMAGSDGQYKNATKLSIFPARSWTGSTAAFDAIGGYGGLWSSTQTPKMTSSSGFKSDPAVDVLYYHIAATANAGAFRMGFMDKYGLAQPVRCVRDLLIPKVVLCGECTGESIQLKAVVNVDSCALLNSSKTFVASKLHPEVDSKFTGLQSGKYYVVSTSSTGNVSIDSVTILTKVHTTCSGIAREGTEISSGVYADKEWSSASNVIDSVSDHQGNVYEVVQIGNYCWLKENMRTTQTNTGVDLTNNTGITTPSTTAKYYYVSDKADKYGYLYNYPAATNICPSGWHLPSDAEWKNMVVAAGVTDNNPTTGTGLGRLVTGCDWQSVISDPSDPKPGNYEYAERNLSGFSALPAGEWNEEFYAIGVNAEFWTATKNNSNAWYRGIGYQDGGTHRMSPTLGRAYSVRCVREASLSAVVDSVTCTSMMITAKAFGLGTISSKSVNAYTNANCTGTAITGTVTVTNDTITATFNNKLKCNTRYWFKLTAGDGTNTATTIISDSTRDLTLGKATTCTVSSIRAQSGSDLSSEHSYNGSTTQIDSVYDHEGNRYAVVQIGDQCWLKENMRATTNVQGESILQNPETDQSYSEQRAYYYSNGSSNYAKYGCLYNFPAAMNIADQRTSFGEQQRGICPKGWHVPTDDEWLILEKNVLSGITATSASESGTSYRGTGAGKLAGGCDWTANGSDESTQPGNYSYSARNNTDFDAFPAGFYNGNHSFTSIGTFAYFWSSTPDGQGYAFSRGLNNSKAGVYRVNSQRYCGFSIRCVRDYPIPVTISFNANGGSGTMTAMNVTTMKDTVLDENTFTHEGNFEFAGWNTMMDGTGTAYADHSHIVPTGSMTLYAQWNSYCSVSSVLGHEHGYNGASDKIDSVYDYEGNDYAVVQMGDQCWLKQNLRTENVNSKGNVYTPTIQQTPGYNVTTYGRLYDWAAVMQGANASTAVPSGVRGICPEGWHVPSANEWDTLTYHVFSNDDYKCGCNAGSEWISSAPCIANALSAATGWTNSALEGCNAGNASAKRNLTGFSVIPVGYYHHESSTVLLSGNYAYFWSATDFSLPNRRSRTFCGDNSNVIENYGNEGFGFSVRCVRNTPAPVTISFNANGGSGTMDAINVTTMTGNVTLPSNAFNHGANFAFAGWGTDQCSSEIAYTAGASITPTESITLYAQWNSYCDASSILAQSGFDLSHEHAYKGAANKIDSVYDHEGNAYAVVQIGNQCWLKENMRATTEPGSSTSIIENPANFINMSNTNPRAYYYNNSVTSAASYGCLYNFPAMMNISSEVSVISYPCRGICPKGWHIPQDSEWTEMLNTMSVSEGISGNGAGKLVASCQWTDCLLAEDCPGNYSYANRNSSGFSALPAGYFGMSGFCPIVGQYADFWSATRNSLDNTQAINRGISYINTWVDRQADSGLGNGYSVRCVRDDN